MSKQTIFLTLLILSVLLNQVYSLKKIKRDDEANEDNYDYYRTIRQISIKSFQLSIQQ